MIARRVEFKQKVEVVAKNLHPHQPFSFSANSRFTALEGGAPQNPDLGSVEDSLAPGQAPLALLPVYEFRVSCVYRLVDNSRPKKDCTSAAHLKAFTGENAQAEPE